MFENERCCNEKTASMNTAYPDGNMNMENSMYMGMGAMPYGACCPVNPCPMMCPPVYECPQEKVCHRTIEYEVPHMIPCHTRMINHHVYRHTYTPCYSYSEEDEYTNVYGNRCC